MKLHTGSGTLRQSCLSANKDRLRYRAHGQKGTGMKAYFVKYRMSLYGDVRGVGLLAKSKTDAYDKAVYEEIPQKEGCIPYSAWVYSVTYNNGNCTRFNTHEGKPY